ncbi:biotin--[acetyl-CoA-carboxylase] ligase [Yaniella halotolerans]|uniref:biotin--[acetyl-CoA-carboxylase] ligase n=1 Tax=Yaniella halotolerans TaxID=225453 RepID=UPI0003B60BB7|nr:biotin--[acetyl-CoA-carboxylase] ligase [Yaniella halotolerans]
MAQKEHRRIASGVYWAEQVASTQDVVVAGASNFVHGDVLATDNQTAGRGRLDRSWDTPAGTAAAMSMVLRPHLEPQQFGMLTLVVADALVRWFRELNVHAGVKWPNDVLGPDGKKLCGILAQWIPETKTVVVGIGTNLEFGQAKVVATAAALADYGVTMTAHEYVKLARRRLLDAVADFEADPTAQRFEPTMSTLGQYVRAKMPDGKDIVGTAIGLGDTGSLLIQDETMHEVFAADIVHLRSA